MTLRIHPTASRSHGIDRQRIRCRSMVRFIDE